MSKPKFNPNAEFQPAKPKFDPNAAFSSVGQLESGLRGAAQGATLGFADEATAALESGLGSLGVVPDKTYEQAVSESRKNYQTAQEANPITYGAGQVGGSIASALALPGAAATLGGRALQAGALGAIQGYGSTDNREDLIQNMALGGATGAIMAPAAEKAIGATVSGADKLRQYLGTKLGKGAEKLAEKATGATGKQAAKFKPNTGRELLDRGLVTFGDTPENISNKLSNEVKRSGSVIDEALTSSNELVNVNDIASGLEDRILQLQSTPEGRLVAKQLQNVVDDIYESGVGFVTPTQAETTKKAFDKRIKNWIDQSVGVANKEARNAYRNAVEDTIEKSTNMAPEFLQAKKDYGMFAPVQEAAESRASQLQQSPFGGLQDTASVIAGGGGLPGVATAIGRKIAANRAASSSAVIANKISKGLKMGSFGKFEQQLKSALARGNQAVVATDFLLRQTSPEYREMMDKDGE